MSICLAAYAFILQGMIPELFNDINELRPTFLAGAPRVWQRLHDKMWLTINSGSWFNKQLFAWGYSSKLATKKVFLSFSLPDSRLFPSSP